MTARHSSSTLLDRSRRRPLKNTCVAIGDSMTAWGDQGLKYQPLIGQQYLHMLQVESYQRVKESGIFAWGGYTLKNHSGGLVDMVLAMSPLPGACVIALNNADIALDTGYSFALNQVILQQQINRLLDAGIVPILWTCPPMHYGGALSADTVNTRAREWNYWIRRFAGVNGYAVIDTAAALTGADGQYISGVCDDTLHPNFYGQWLIAQQALGDGVADIFPHGSQVLGSRSSNDLFNLLNDGTTNLGVFSTATSGVATGFSGSGSGTKALIDPLPRDFINGRWQQLTATSGADATVSRTISSGWSVGDKIQFTARVQTEGVHGSGGYFNLFVQLDVPGGYMTALGSATTLVAGLYDWEDDVTDGLVFVEFSLPTGTTGVSFVANNLSIDTGTALLRYAEPSVINLTTGGFLV